MKNYGNSKWRNMAWCNFLAWFQICLSQVVFKGLSVYSLAPLYYLCSLVPVLTFLNQASVLQNLKDVVPTLDPLGTDLLSVSSNSTCKSLHLIQNVKHLSKMLEEMYCFLLSSYFWSHRKCSASIQAEESRLGVLSSMSTSRMSGSFHDYHLPLQEKRLYLYICS